DNEVVAALSPHRFNEVEKFGHQHYWTTHAHESTPISQYGYENTPAPSRATPLNVCIVLCVRGCTDNGCDTCQWSTPISQSRFRSTVTAVYSCGFTRVKCASHRS